MYIKLEKLLNNKKTQIVFIALMFLFLLIAGTRHYVRHVKGYADESIKIMQIMCDNMPFEQAKNNQVVAQALTIEKDFDGFELRMGGTSAELTGSLQVELYDEAGSLVNTWKDDLNNYQFITFYEFHLPNTIKVDETTVYTIKWWISNLDEENYQFYFYRTPGDNYLAGKCFLDEEEQPWDLECNVFQDNTTGKYSFIKVLYWVVIILSCAAIVACFLFFFKWKLPVEKLFLLVVGGLGILYMLILPPFSAPDELVHFSTSYNVSNLMMGKGDSDVSGYIYVRADDAKAMYGAIPSMNTYDFTFKNMFSTVEDDEMVLYMVPRIMTQNHFTHFPSAVGITLGRLLHLGSVPTIYLGRLMNLLFYLTLVYWAIKKIPFGKYVMLAISAIPMTLELISSYSYDPIVNGLAFFTIAWILDCIYTKEKITWKEISGLIILAALLGPAKMVYSVIFLLCIFIPKEKFGKKMYFYLAGVGVVLALLLSNLLINLGVIMGMTGAASNSGAENAAVAAPQYYTLSWCLEHPIDAIAIYARTTIVNGYKYLAGMFGSALGWVEVCIEKYIIIAFMIAGFCMLFVRTSNEKNDRIKTKHTIVALVCCVVVYMLVLTSMFFGWTLLGNPVIDGVQGRYFLPIIPLIALIIRKKRISLPENCAIYLIAGIIVLNYVTFTQILSTICTR